MPSLMSHMNFAENNAITTLELSRKSYIGKH